MLLESSPGRPIIFKYKTIYLIFDCKITISFYYNKFFKRKKIISKKYHLSN